jgi:hypothetical protein
MKMRQKKARTLTIILLALAFLALFSLGAQQQGCNQKDQGVKFNTTALSLSFVDQAPASIINLGVPFQIYLRAENQGEFDVAPGTAKFYLTGIGNNLRNVNPRLSNQVLLNKETGQQEAGFEIIKFAENAEPAIQISNPFNFTMRADACYSYATHTEATACIGKGDSACPITGEKITTGSNSNGPIQITSLTEQVEGNKIYIAFIITNKGEGDAYYSDMDCDKFFGQDSSERNRQILKKNYVEISVDPGTEQDLTCNLLNPTGGPSTTNSGMAPVGTKVTCSKIVGQETHSSPITINLVYKYLSGISKSITIFP